MNNSPGVGNLTMAVVYGDMFVMSVTKNVIVVALGISINCINATMVHTFNKYQIFWSNPRYILFIHLVVNDMLQLITSISLFVFIYAFYTINVSLCFIFLLPAIFTTQNTPLNLALMGAECCIAVCIPLRHASICTVKRTYIMIGSIWAISMFSVLPDLFIVVATEPSEFYHSSVFCSRDSVFKGRESLMKRDASHITFLIVVWITLFYAYFRILFAAKALNTHAKKARNTIILHGFQVLLCMITYVQPMIVQGITSVFPRSPVSFIMFLINQIFPRLISPIIYGVRDLTFRNYFKKQFLCSVIISTHSKVTLKTKIIGVMHKSQHQI